MCEIFASILRSVSGTNGSWKTVVMYLWYNDEDSYVYGTMMNTVIFGVNDEDTYVCSTMMKTVIFVVQ